MIGAAFMPAGSAAGVHPSVFTQCSKCETVFRLSAHALRAAGGQVRCGRCGEVFNALARLAENATEFVKGESPLDLETRADEILEITAEGIEEQGSAPSEMAKELAAPPGVEIAQLQILDPLDDDPSLEYTLPPGELDRIFIETRPGPLQLFAGEGPPAEPVHAEPASAELMPGAAVPGGAVPPAPPAPVAAPAAPVTRVAAPVAPVTVALAPPAIPARIWGLEVSEDVREDMLANRAQTDPPPLSQSRRGLPLSAWVAAAIMLGILLATQIIGGHRAWLAAHAHLLGAKAAPPANLSAYQLRQWGVTGDAGAKGTLRVRASIMNTATQLQPYPLLRVTLADRFGTRVGAREFEPFEYLDHAPARMLAPGERLDATLDIMDPGKDAESFEIDVCVRGLDQRILCAGEAAAQVQ